MEKIFSFICLLCISSLAIATPTQAERDSIQQLLDQASGTVPTITNNSRHARGATMVFARFKVTGVTTANILEQGICWNEEGTPTVLDDKSSEYLTHNGQIYVARGLKPASVYYIRPYAITKTYAVGYGDEIKVVTLPIGTAAATYDGSVESADNATKTRIHNAIETALDYWHNLTNIRGKQITVYYSTGVPTAEASYSGYLAFGSNSSYQATGTALHEMAHTAGVGQSSTWTWSSSPLHSGSGTRKWTGDRANEVVRFLENNDAAGVTGDQQHMWGTGASGMVAFGINGAFEDTNEDLQYIYNALVLQALGEDGLCPTYSETIASPYYAFDFDPTTKYYLSNEAYGQGASYLVEQPNGTLQSVAMTTQEILNNDSAAWVLDFNTTNCHYTLRNVATGHYMTQVGDGAKGVQARATSTPDDKQGTQIMRSRHQWSTTLHGRSFTAPSYLVSVNPGYYGDTMQGNADGSVSNEFYSLDDTQTQQRWLILSSQEVSQLGVVQMGGCLSDIEIDGASLSGFSSEYREYDYNVAPGTAVSEITINPIRKEDFDGQLEQTLPESLPGTATILALSGGSEVLDSYSINLVENYLYEWDGRNVVGAGTLPSQFGWTHAGQVEERLLNDTDTTMHYIDANSIQHEGYKMPNNSDFGRGRLLQLPFLSDESYALHIHNLQAGRQYELRLYVCQSYREKSSSPRVYTTLVTNDGTELATDNTLATSALQKFKLLKMDFAVPEGISTEDITLQLTVEQTCAHIITLAGMQLTDEGAVDAIQQVGTPITNGTLYDLSGRRITTLPTHGVYIRGGKKILR